MYCAEDILLLSIVKHFVRSIHITLCLFSKQRLTQAICVDALSEGTYRANTIPYPQLIRDRLYDRPIQIKFLTRSTRCSLKIHRLDFTPGYSSVSAYFTWQMTPICSTLYQVKHSFENTSRLSSTPRQIERIPFFFYGIPHQDVERCRFFFIFSLH